jgi:nicotinate-nucleotide adenylyltransferase
VIFIPAAIPPHKDMEEIIESSHRLEMLQRAALTNAFFSISDIELMRPGKSYSIDTIRYFSGIYQGPLFFIVEKMPFQRSKPGRNLDLFPSATSSYCPGFRESISPNFQRFESSFRYDLCGKPDHGSGNDLYKEITFLDISSTKIRN